MATKNGTSGNDTLNGTAAADRLNGLEGDDVLNGRGGNDTLDGGSGSNTLRGGGGDDLYLVTPISSNSLIDTGGWDTVIATNTSWGLTDGMDVLILRGSENHPNAPAWLWIDGQGNDLDNTIRDERTGSREVWLDGGGGDDVLLGGEGSNGFTFGTDESGSHGDDYVDGGGGQDVLFLGTGPVVIDLRDGFAFGPGGTVTFENIEEFGTGTHNDKLTGDGAANFLAGGTGDDTISGGGGSDRLWGDLVLRKDGNMNTFGHDRLLGGGGNDTIEAGSGNDYVNGGAGRDRVNARGGNDRLVWDSNDFVVDGDFGDDVLDVAAGNLDLRSVPDNRILGIETVDLEGGGNNRLTLTEADLLAISSETDTLKVLGGAGDSINIVGAFTDEGVSDGFHRYQVGAGTLLVDTDITNVA